MANLPEDTSIQDSANERAFFEASRITLGAGNPPKPPTQSDDDTSSEELGFPGLIDQPLVNKEQLGKLNALAPISLAYIGDAVFELYVRSRLLTPAKRIRDYHQLVVEQVKAERQSYHLDTLTPHLTSDELDILRRGRNATTGRNRRASGQDYQKATGFEALIGFLYLSDQSRLMTLLNCLEI
ncbi:MAG: ribonuclease III domain-containing protein [Cyanobacteria bacterium J06649_4]